MTYATEYEFYADTARLIIEGATLRDLHDALLTVKELRAVDASPQRLRQLAENSFAPPDLLRIRLAELFDGLEVAHSDDYVLAMVGALGGRGVGPALMHLIRNDDAFREEVFWRIFEVEGGGEISLANVDKFANGEDWRGTVIALVADGTLDRPRVLRACLEALNRDFSAYRVGWFSREYTALEPTAEESAADQDLLRLSLSSPVTATVSLAVKHLVAVHKAGLLDAPAFVESSQPALAGPKGAATAALRVLSAVAAAGDAEPDAVAEAVAHGLGHPHADVQRASVALLLKLGAGELAEQARGMLAPAVADELLPKAPSEEDAGGSTVSPAAPLLSEPEPVRPWSDDDARERYAALLEDSSDAIEFELALAWLTTSAAVPEVLAPLEKRARKLAEDDEHWAAALLLAALDPDRDFLPLRYYRSMSTLLVNGEWVTEYGEPEVRPTAEESTVLPSLVVRVREVAAIVQGRLPRRPLLATPDDTQGWIGGDSLLERLHRSEEPPLSADLAQAVLRVRPEDRDRVLEATGAQTIVTEQMRIEWRSRESESRKPNGQAEWVWWDPVIHADSAEYASSEHPALIPSTPKELWRSYRSVSGVVAAELALVHPPTTLRLTAVGVGVLNSAVQETSEHRAASILTALANHAGVWTAQTMQLVALGMSAASGEIRAQAAELFAAAIPARIRADVAAEGFAACAPACVLTRWAGSFSDAASLAPAAVVEVLTGQLSRMDRAARGIGALLTVLLDESIRLGRPVTDGLLRDWLSEFTGSSAAAKAAKGLLRIESSERHPA